MLVVEIWGWGHRRIKGDKALAPPVFYHCQKSLYYFTFRIMSNLIQIKGTEVNPKCGDQCSVEKL